MVCLYSGPPYVVVECVRAYLVEIWYSRVFASADYHLNIEDLAEAGIDVGNALRMGLLVLLQPKPPRFLHHGSRQLRRLYNKGRVGSSDRGTGQPATLQRRVGLLNHGSK
jgi:hypothetical protein